MKPWSMWWRASRSRQILYETHRPARSLPAAERLRRTHAAAAERPNLRRATAGRAARRTSARHGSADLVAGGAGRTIGTALVAVRSPWHPPGAATAGRWQVARRWPAAAQ